MLVDDAVCSKKKSPENSGDRYSKYFINVHDDVA